MGLNLAGADRAIIMDPDWNPANDNQAVDRIFRIGQKRDVIVYRLVTMSSIEEMIYRR
jgi:SNF2 family DNA or RNA helicase